MELKITAFFNSVNPCALSASVVEIGDDAGAVTWSNSVEMSRTVVVLDTEEKRVAFRTFVGDSGGWTDEEIAAWSDDELNALCLQWVAGDMREPDGFELDFRTTDEQWAEYQEQSMLGNCSGRLFKGTDGEVYFYIGT